MSQDSPLLALAPELRNDIYRHVLVSDAAIDIGSESSATQPSILQTCRQIREEAESIYYHENIFAATASPYGMGNYLRVHGWLCKIGAARCAMMANLRLNLGPSKYNQSSGPDAMCKQRRSTIWDYARRWVRHLAGSGVPLSAIHFKAPSEIKTLTDAFRATWWEAGERALQERLAGNGRS